MPNNPEPIEVSIIARIQGLLDGLGQATSGVKSATNEMAGSLGGLGKMVDNLKAPFLAITGLLAGGAMFKGAVDATVSWNGEIIKLARTLGISTEEASALNVALGDIYTDAATYTGAVNKLMMQVNSGGEGFKKLGLSVRDANGNLKPSTQLMAEVLGKLNGIEAGTARNAAGVAIFGRAWGEAQKLLKLNSQVLDEAREKAEQLNLIVGGDAVEAQKRYKAAMNDVEDVLTGIKLSVGKELLPVLTDLGKWFASVAPDVIPKVTFAMKVLINAFYDLELGVRVVWNLLRALWETGEAVANGLSRAFTAIIHGSWGDLKNSFKGVGDAISASWSNAMDRMLDDATRTNDKVARLWAPKAPSKGTKLDQASGGFNPDKGKDNSDEVLAAFKLELEKKKAEEGNWFTWSTQKELDFWSAKLDQVKEGSKAYLAILTEENKLKRKIAEEEQAKAKADFDLRVAQLREGSQERVTLAQQEADRLAGVYGRDSRQYIEAMARVEKAKQEHAEKMRQVDQLIADGLRDARLAALDQERAIMEDEASMGLISRQQMLAAELQHENAKYQIKLAEAKREAALEPDPAKRQAALNKISEIERQHAAQVNQINSQATKAQWAQWNSFFMTLTSGWDSSVKGLIHGTMTWGDAFKNVLSSALDSLISFFVQWAAEAAAAWAANLILGNSTRATEAQGAAAVYAINAAGSVAAIPVWGWAVAPGVGEAAYGWGLKMAGLASAAGGWDRVPGDQLAAIHKDEMVLSPKVAGWVRSAAGGEGAQGSSSGSASPVHVHFHGDLVDGNFWSRHQGSILRTLGDAVKNRRKP